MLAGKAARIAAMMAKLRSSGKYAGYASAAARPAGSMIKSAAKGAYSRFKYGAKGTQQAFAWGQRRSARPRGFWQKLAGSQRFRQQLKRRIILEGAITGGVGGAALSADYAARKKLGMLQKEKKKR